MPLPIVLKAKLMATTMAGWTAAAAPIPMPAESVATLIAANAAGPIPVDLYDENDHQKGLVAIWRDGSTDDDTTDLLKHMFRCRRTYREHRSTPYLTRAFFGMIAERMPATLELALLAVRQVGRRLVAHIGQVVVLHLAYVFTIQNIFTGCYRIQTAQYVHQCTFTRTRWSHQCHVFVFKYVERDAFQHFNYLFTQVIIFTHVF